MKRKLTFLLTVLLLLTGMGLQAQTYTWVSTPLSELTTSDVFVIVGYNGSNYAMTNSNGTSAAPAALAVTVSGNTLTGDIADNIQWTISGNATNGYTFYPNGSTNTWLYCTSSNNGVRVGTNTNNTFHVDAESNYLVHNGTSRYIGIYSSQDWRCYTTINNNITGQTFAYYKRVSGSSSTPYFTAEDVEIEYDATSGDIEYTVNNPVTGGTVSASTTSDWLTLGTVGTTVPFTCTANSAASARTATVTLTYSYNTNQVVSKSVTVTQEGNPNNINTISDITAAGTYAVQGTIVAKSTRGFIVGDGTGYVYYYNQNYSQSSYNIGDMVRLSGTVVAYNGVFEFNNTTTVTTATSSNYVEEEPTVITGEEMDTRVASNSPTQLSTYVQYIGTLSVSGTYYNITNIEGATTAKGSISFPTNTDFTTLNGQEVVVKGYYVGNSSSQYYNTMIGSVEENVVVLPEAATPTFTPAAGTYLTTQSVSISSTTEGATIYYTTDGSEPTTSSSVYSTPITVSSSMTIKAIAAADGYENSAVAEATYTINEPMTIAAARVLANNQNACVEGIVIFLDGRNVYIQDETAGIDLYLNTNTVPASLALGDKVRAFGSKTVYKGLVELTGINGGDANVFSVISTGNTLPTPATHTIAEINSDFSGDNMIQSTRVKVENATIGAINTSGTTVISQEGETLNVYLIPEVPGMMEGDEVTITGVLGCYNNPQLRVVSANDIVFSHSPVLTANPPALSGFTYEYENGGPSEVASFLISGDNLTNNVAVYPSESFEVSTNTVFRPENPAMIYIPGSGHFYDINIYVRMKAGLEGGTYNEQLYAVSEGADTLFINVTGTVTGGTPTPPEPPTPGDGNYVRISDLNGLADGDYIVFAARFDDNATSYYAMSNTSSGKPTGVLFTSATVDDDEVLPASIVDEEASYYWVVGVTADGYTFTNAAGELIGYSSSTNFATGGDNTEWNIEVSTAGESAMVPGYTGFYITNVNTPGRGFALNSQHNYGAYAVSNNNGSGYNFYLDIFVKTEGGVPPTPTVATPTFTPAAGTYFEEQSVSIACATDGATIYYSTTSENGPWMAYTNAITVSESMTLWAYAEKEGYNNSSVAEAEYIIQMGFVTIFNQDWEGEMNGWTFVDVQGEAQWTVGQNSGNHYAYANGYNHGANVDWCISPAFNLDAYDNPTLTFRTAKNYTGPDLEVYFSNNYNGTTPASATWTQLTCALSTGSWTWVESGDIDLSGFSGNNCYIGFKYISEESSAAAWEVDDIMLVGQTSDPVVTVTPLTLTGFTYIEGNGPSDEQSFTVSGLNLSANVVIDDAADYEISLGSGDDFTAQSTLTLSHDNGTIEETTIYVRLKAGLAVGDYNDEDITVTCADVDDIEVTCSGSVTEQPVPGDDYVRISDVGQLAAGNRVILAARYDDTEDAYLAAANTLTSGKLTTTEFTSVMNGDDEIIPASILAAEDSFYWTVDITDDGYTFTNANGDMIGYGNSGTNLVMNGEKTVWTIEGGVSAPESLVPEYFGFNIVNATNDTRAIALRVTDTESVLKAYATSNMTNGEYNFFLDIFMQGEGGVPPTPTVAAPTFNPAAGTYYETQDVTISCATSDATIYYRLGSETGPWNEYEEAITVDENMTIWAYAAKEGYNDSPVVSAEYVIQNDIVIIFNQDWEEDWHGWTEVNVEGEDAEWTIAEHSGNHYAYMNGYNHGANEDWLISPAFDLDSYSDVVLTFITAMNYTGPAIEVLFSNDYDGTDPNAANWEPLTCELSSGSWAWTESGEISLDEFNGTNCYIAFKYICSESEAAAWEVDDILLVSGSTIAGPTLTATPNTINGLDYMEGEGPSDPQSYELTGANLEGEGDVTVTASEGFQVSLDGEDFFETVYVQFADGELVNQPVTIYVHLVEGLEVGPYTGTITHEGGGATTEVILNGTVHSEDEPMMVTLMPYYIQGNNGSNNNRVPVATAAYLLNLEPETTYRYTNQFVDANDGPETAGAGNVIYANPEGFYRSTSPSLSTEGGYGEFTTDEDGIAMVWFINEPTANTRFTPGNEVYLRVRLNDGHDGTTVEQIFTSDDYATVLNFGTERDAYQGTAFYAKSDEPAMTFAMLHSDADDERPLYSTSIETVGVDYGSINQYADFYKEEVAGKDGWFGGILPNNNKDGVNAIWIVDIEGNILNEYQTENGEWHPEAHTVNPNGGIDEPIFIDLTDDGVDETILANVKVWNTDHEFIIENDDDTHYTMTVYNVLGQPMMQHQINAGSSNRISHNLAAGVYVIRLQNNQSHVSVKVIVR